MPRRRLSADQVVGRMVAGVQANVGRYVDGVRNTVSDPLALAAAAIPKAVAAYTEAANSGRMAAGLAGSSKAEWMAGATADGGNAYVAGVVNKTPKITRKYGPALATTYDVAESVDAMPTMTVTQRIAKSSAYQQKRYDAARPGARR